jgi:hypothetical protein
VSDFFSDDGPAAANLRRLFELARGFLPGPLDPSKKTDRGWARLRERVLATPLRRSRWRMWLVPAATALAGGGLYLALRSPSLSFTVAGTPARTGKYLTAEADTGLRFSDGTEVELEHASGGVVASTGPHGARVLLHHGRAHVRVVPRRDNEWVFEAGPCRLQVTGTKFDMHWSQREQVLEVLLYKGSVVVKGPPAPDGVVLHEAQRLVMDVGRGLTRLGPLRPAVPPEAVVVETVPAAEPPPPTEAPPATSPARTRPEPPVEGWSARVLAGDFDRVLREARRRGFTQVLGRGGAPEVMALAEAARYSHRLPLARRALGAVRDRFPGSPHAQKAAFLLGRMAEDQNGDVVAALAWYSEYLAATPDGPYRDEALGRKMAAVQRLSGSARARPLAEEYLRRYPDGAYAAPARALLQSGR